MAETHDPGATLDQIRAYHFGPRFLVEIEIVMLPETPLRESHDVGIVLQHKIERLEQVERCFVHVDYQERDVDDHDPLTPLEYKTQEAARLPPRDKLSPNVSSRAGGNATAFALPQSTLPPASDTVEVGKPAPPGAPFEGPAAKDNCALA